jgi:DNA helicase INO80
LQIEIDVLVDLSQRQRAIYKALRQRVSISDLIAQANNLNDSAGAKNLMNLVMQFRKVCNHPDLFERADVVSPFMFGSFAQSGNLAREGDMLYLPDSAKNAIDVRVPRLLWEEKVDRPSEQSKAGSEGYVLRNLMSIWKTDWVNESLKEEQSRFGFLRIMGKSPAEAVKMAKGHPLVSLLRDSEEERERINNGPFETDRSFAASSLRKFEPLAPRLPHARPPTDTPLRDITFCAWNKSYLSRQSARFALEHAVAPIIRPAVSARSYVDTLSRLSDDPLLRKALYGVTTPQRDDPSAVSRLTDVAPGVPPIGLLAAAPKVEAPIPSLVVPPIKRLIVDSAKLARLDDLLREIKHGGHRVLLYFQMTKMMDLVEEYLIYRQYKYLRLDGSSAIGDRRDMVTSWQTK